MPTRHKFLISFIVNNQPQTIEILQDADTCPIEKAEILIRESINQPEAVISDIQVTSIHHTNNPNVHPGHYQQPEGNS
jgi:hypothetical protein